MGTVWKGGVVNKQTHWEDIYKTKPSTGVSWFAHHLERSLELLHRYGPPSGGNVVDIGGGASTLVDDLTEEGIWKVTVLDLSSTSLGIAQTRMGQLAEKVDWVEGDVIRVNLPSCHFDLWHDRAVFHFLTLPVEREAYVSQVTHCLKPGGHVIISTFGPEGPEKCSGLDVVRYDAKTLHQTFGPRFALKESLLIIHQTPSGKEQQFQVCVFRWDG